MIGVCKPNMYCCCTLVSLSSGPERVVKDKHPNCQNLTWHTQFSNLDGNKSALMGNGK